MSGQGTKSHTGQTGAELTAELVASQIATIGAAHIEGSRVADLVEVADADAVRVFKAAAGEDVGEPIVVVVNAVAAFALGSERCAIGVGAVTIPVQVVVAPIAAHVRPDLVLSRCAAIGIECTCAVVAIHQAVAIVVDAIAAHLGRRYAARRRGGAFAVRTVRGAVAVVVISVDAAGFKRLTRGLTDWTHRTVGIVTVDEPVAVFVDGNLAKLSRQAERAQR